MTKKDYIKIAEIFRKHMGGEVVSEYDTAVQAIILDMVDMLQKDNPRFDREKFIKYITN